MPKFEEDDVVRFADGNGKMHLWGDNVEIDTMFVKETIEEDGLETVVVTSYPYTFQFKPEELVKVGRAYDTEYCNDPESEHYGNEIYKWLPELNERDDDESDEG